MNILNERQTVKTKTKKEGERQSIHIKHSRHRAVSSSVPVYKTFANIENSNTHTHIRLEQLVNKKPKKRKKERNKRRSQNEFNE